MSKHRDYIQTYTKKVFDPFNICAEDINIEDIAHSLSMTVRANGHIKHFYSVAQHAIDCVNEAKARKLSRRIALACLLHDASECYIADIPRPVKHRLNGYARIEEKISEAVFLAFGAGNLTEEERREVADIDDALLYHEFLALADLALFEPAPRLIGAHSFEYEEMRDVKAKFIDIFTQLTKAE